MNQTILGIGYDQNRGKNIIWNQGTSRSDSGNDVYRTSWSGSCKSIEQTSLRGSSSRSYSRTNSWSFSGSIGNIRNVSISSSKRR